MFLKYPNQKEAMLRDTLRGYDKALHLTNGISSCCFAPEEEHISLVDGPLM